MCDLHHLEATNQFKGELREATQEWREWLAGFAVNQPKPDQEFVLAVGTLTLSGPHQFKVELDAGGWAPMGDDLAAKGLDGQRVEVAIVPLQLLP